MTGASIGIWCVQQLPALTLLPKVSCLYKLNGESKKFSVRGVNGFVKVCVLQIDQSIIVNQFV